MAVTKKQKQSLPAKSEAPKKPMAVERPEVSRPVNANAGTEKSVKGKAQPLVQVAYETIKERIINLHFLPGQYLNEAAICAQLKLGRTPVHQALQRLQLDGLVDVLPRKGVIVQPDSVGEILKILNSRVTVEPELARAAAQRAAAGYFSRAQLDNLTKLAVASVEEDPPDIAAFTSNDRRFHREIAQLSGNEVMSDFARVLHERSARFWYLNMWQTIDVAATNRQHADIAAAIVAGDDAVAARRMLDHIAALRERLERLQRMSPGVLRAVNRE